MLVRRLWIMVDSDKFWQLLVQKGCQHYCVGEDSGVTFIQNTAALQDSSRRQIEEVTYIMFVDFIEKCEQKEICGNVSNISSGVEKSLREYVTLEDILLVCTGTTKIPPDGFYTKPYNVFF
uniref:Uncharacterized protein n=1 Tax=Amphimedon queenslandica TaxID=400682 RepID=A0A1X7VKU1_AMPQE